jgi:hypothetical protein
MIYRCHDGSNVDSYHSALCLWYRVVQPEQEGHADVVKYGLRGGVLALAGIHGKNSISPETLSAQIGDGLVDQCV